MTARKFLAWAWIVLVVLVLSVALVAGFRNAENQEEIVAAALSFLAIFVFVTATMWSLENL